jgi:DUF4097 and DUF4098 domain-containing protein YvlB
MSRIKRNFLFFVTAAAILLGGLGGWRSLAQSEVTQDFQQTYPMTADGRIQLENINGSVKVSTWDRAEVKVVAVKHAYKQERLDEAQIKIQAGSDNIRISTEYPHRDQSFYSDGNRRFDNPASVDYTLTVPRNARLDSVELINGNLDLDALAGDVHASCINGKLSAAGLTGEVRLSTVNGRLEAGLNGVGDTASISLESVNGSVKVTLPSDVQAQLKAETIHGGISNNFGVPVRDGKYFGHNLSALLGNGGAKIRLSNVNGGIAIDRASDGRTPSKVTNLLNETSGDVDSDNDANGDDDDSASDLVEAQNDLREAQKELEHAQRELERSKTDLARATEEARKADQGSDEAAREAARDALNDAQEAQRDAENDRAEAEKEIKDLSKQIEDLSKHRDESRTQAKDARETAREARRTQQGEQRMQRQIQRDAQRDAQRAVRDAQREIEQVGPAVERATRDLSDTFGRMGGGEMGAVERESKTFAVTGAPQVRVETFDGAISYRVADQPQVSYSVVKRAHDAEQLKGIRVTAEQSGNTINIKVDFDRTYAKKLTNGFSINATASLEVLVPRNASVSAVSSDGNVRIEGITGNIAARTGDGSISLSDGQGNATLQSGDGRISINGFNGQVEAQTGDGSINLDGQFSGVTAHTGDGSISLTVPANANLTIESNTDDVRFDGVNSSPVTGTTRGVRRWNIGSGGTVFSLHTGDGRITVRQ